MHLIGLCVVIAGLSGVAHAADKPKTLVELYTSQGCSSCPPADAYLGELAKRDDIIALSFHVDYWDYIGWKDRFAIPANTSRQRTYAKHLGMGYVYTPQIVVQGMAHTTGSDRDQVENLIRDLEGAKRLDVRIRRLDGGVQIDVPAGTFEDETARILLAAYDDKQTSDIQRGENAGRELAHYNVVRDFAQVGQWSGDAVTVDVAEDEIGLAGRNGCTVIVQSMNSGRVLGAAKLGLGPQS